MIAVSDIEFMDPTYSYSIEFNIFGDNKDGQILMDNNIYYNIFINGELYTFTAEEYPDLGELGITEITDIPVFLSTDEDIYSYGNYHGISFKRNDIQTIGIRALYLDGDIRGESEIVTVNTYGETVSVGSLVTNSSSKTEMFDLNGRKIANPAKGSVIIKRTTTADGNVTVEKIIKH